jgi:hypothetical protein
LPGDVLLVEGELVQATAAVAIIANTAAEMIARFFSARFMTILPVFRFVRVISPRCLGLAGPVIQVRLPGREYLLACQAACCR